MYVYIAVYVYMAICIYTAICPYTHIAMYQYSTFLYSIHLLVRTIGRCYFFPCSL